MAVLIIVALSMGAWAEDYRGLEQKVYELELNQTVQEVINDQKQRAMQEKLDAIEMQRTLDKLNNSPTKAPPTPYTVPREVK